ncbi:hypothetical protein ACHAW5_006069 [Stephanodiscus triporus]|uniref:Protochlorophyllide reductase n=1 Tax=Stephanodiscus triporus TaxID=2934178 RepID=A0ABD3NAS2_9STRA
MPPGRYGANHHIVRWSVSKTSCRRTTRRRQYASIDDGAPPLPAAVVAIDGMAKDVNKKDNRVVLVTGGSSGLGLETVKRLAAAGATVVLMSRTEAKGRRAVEVANDHLLPEGKLPTRGAIHNIVLDLDDLSGVMLVPSRYEALGLNRDISVLVNNAGVVARTFQSNHLGHFVLTSALFPYLSREGTRIVTVSSSASYFAGPDGLDLDNYEGTRIVTVSSSASYFAGPDGLDLDNINGERSYGAWPSYSSSKLANVLLTRELQRRADDAHPGVVGTDLWRYVVGEGRLARMKDGRDRASTQVCLAATVTLS